jgi:hypothetical protein
MSDDTDLATDREEKERERAIAYARRPAAVPLGSSTECWNLCGTSPRENSHYCSAECLADHERRNKLAARRGGA